MNLNNLLEPQKWVEHYGDALYAYTLKRIGNNSEQAEDIVQETFLSAWKNRTSFNGAASEKTWLYVICKNKIIDYYRKQGKTQLNSIENEAEDNDFFVEDGHFNNAYKPINDWTVNITDLVGKKEFYTVLYSCTSKLKTLQKQVFSLKYLEHIEPEEICNLLGISNKNYWVLIHRAKVQLRTCLEKNWVNA